MSEQGEVKLKKIEELHPVLMDASVVVVLDIEATGFSPKHFAEILEIAAVRLDLSTRKIIGRFSTLVRPSRAFSIPRKIVELTGITWEQVEDKPFIEDVLPEFYKFIGDVPIVAHNAVFDWVRFLVPGFRSVGLVVANEAICSQALARHLYPKLPSGGYGLAALCRMFGAEIEGHHRALQDTLYTASIFVRMLDQYREKYGPEQMSLGECPEKAVPSQPLSSQVGYVDLSRLKVYRISAAKTKNKKEGPSVFVSTNFGRLSYSVRRDRWTALDLWVEQNIPVQAWGQRVLDILDLNKANFVAAYADAG